MKNFIHVMQTKLDLKHQVLKIDNLSIELQNLG